jgi:hypothetical protein
MFKMDQVLPARPQWDKTITAEDRVKPKSNIFRRLIERKKTFQGRPIIGRDRPINGGVYLGAAEREAIVVNDNEDRPLITICKKAIQMLRDNDSLSNESQKGYSAIIWQVVEEAMPYDKSNVEKIVNRLPSPDALVYLSTFIGGGVCRHQALLAGYLLEKLISVGYIKGKVSVDRNQIGKNGHAWVRFIGSEGQIYIFDFLHQSGVRRLNHIPGEMRWKYKRPEES